MQTGTSWESDSVSYALGAQVLGQWSTIMGKTQLCATKQIESEEQFADAWLQGGTLDGHEI